MVDLRPLLSHSCPTATGATREHMLSFLNQRNSNTGPCKVSGKTSDEQSDVAQLCKSILWQQVHLNNRNN